MTNRRAAVAGAPLGRRAAVAAAPLGRRAALAAAPLGRRAALAAALVIFSFVGAGCASRPLPITKIVNGRVIATRSVSGSAYEHSARAMVYEQEGRWEEAVGELRQALLHDNDAPELHARLAEALVRLDRLKDAAAAVQASLQIEVTLAGLVADAHVRQAGNDTSGAVDALKRAVKMVEWASESEQAENAYLELASAEVLALQVDAARTTLRQLCRAAPHSTEGLLRLAAAAWALGSVDEAKDRALAAVKEEPNLVDALMFVAWLQASLGRTDDARAHFDRALDRSEGALEVVSAYARFLVGVGDVKTAQELADELGAADTSNELLPARMELERVVKRPEKALALAKEALSVTGEGELPVDLKAALTLAAAQALDDQDKRPEAVKAYLTVVKEAAAFNESRLRAAALLTKDGKTDEASRVLKNLADAATAGNADVATAARASATAGKTDGASPGATARKTDGASPGTTAGKTDGASPGATARKTDGASPGAAPGPDEALDVELAVALASVDEKKGEAARGIERLDEALTRHPASARLLLVRAGLEERRGRWQAALRTAEMLLAKDPGHVEALNFWGFVAADHQHDLPLAEKRLRAALALEPGAGAIIDSIGWLYFRAGQPDKATPLLEQAGRLEPEDPEILAHLGELYVKRAEPDRAAEAMRKALSLRPDDGLRRKLESDLGRLQAGKAPGP